MTQNQTTAKPKASQTSYQPSVSVVLPCYNEERFIGRVLSDLSNQYPNDLYEIIAVDSGSRDRTRAEILAFTSQHPELEVRLVDNPRRNIAASLNLGIAAARGEVIVRMDAHSVPSSDYVRDCVNCLLGSDAAVVGMPIRIKPGADTLAARAIALAVAHTFGVGDAKYRVSDSTTEQVVDTVPFGVFRKELWAEVGGFNEQLLTNEDYDFYYRVRQLGGRILLGTSSHCLYFARPTLSDLARQYFRYGEWKAQMLKLHPRSLKGRQIVAPLFVVSLLALPLIGFWWPVAWWMVASVLAAYFLLSFIFSMKLSTRSGTLVLVPFLVTTFLVIHTSWGLAFWLGLLHTPKGGIPETAFVEQE